MNLNLLLGTVVFFLHGDISKRGMIAAQYISQYDEDFSFECPPGQYIGEIGSKHDNKREDRIWKYGCRSGLVNNECDWSTDYVNDFDQQMDWTCPNNGLIVGARSTHDNKKEDRRWKFKCCKTEAINKGCESNAMNEYDKLMDFIVSRGYAISGFSSVHDNRREDREWKAKVCKYAKCQAKRMRILSKVDPYLEQAKIVGIATSQGCSKSATFTTSLDNTESVTETSSFTTEKGTSFTFGVALTVEASGSAKFLGSGGEISVGVETSFSNTWEWSSSETKETSSETSSSASQSLEYSGPGAALVMGYVLYYKFDKTSVDVEYDVECDDGTKFTERAKASLKLDRFSQTHFVQKHGTFNSVEDCNEESNQCIQSINGKKVLTPSEITEEFDNCFNGKGTVQTSAQPTNATTTNATTPKTATTTKATTPKEATTTKGNGTKDGISSRSFASHIHNSNLPFIYLIVISFTLMAFFN